MNRRAYEEERLRGVHLSVVIVLTICVAAISASAVSLQWDEVWLLPFLIAGAAFSWVVHVRQIFSTEARLWLYAGVAMATIITDGVHATSVFDFAISIVLALVLFSQTNHKNVLHLCLIVHFFLLANHVMLMLQGRGNAETELIVAEFIVHTAIVFAVYRMAVNIVTSRMRDADEEEREIERLSEMKKNTEDFLTNVSHELRTPINAISGIGSVMLREAQETASAERAEDIVFAGKELSDRIEEMLDYTEIDTGRLLITEEVYTISSIINDVATECSFYPKEVAERIRITVREGIPEKLSGGGKWIRKLLRHQIESAIKGSDTGEIMASVYALERDYGINLCMDVHYTGEVVSRDTVLRVMRVSLSEQKGAYQSIDEADLKLRIIYGLAHAMGGFVRIRSSHTQGTSLQVSVPQHVLRDAPEAEIQKTRHHVVTVQHENRILHLVPGDLSVAIPNGLYVLVVDDEPMNLIVAEGILSDYGMKVETAQSGAEAIERVRSAHYDLIFMDHMMPVMDGVEAAHRIRDILLTQERTTRIIALTANAVSGAKEMFLREGFDEFVAKPIVRTELERALKNLRPGTQGGDIKER